jgi:hypothetical protein
MKEHAANKLEVSSQAPRHVVDASKLKPSPSPVENKPSHASSVERVRNMPESLVEPKDKLSESQQAPRCAVVTAKLVSDESLSEHAVDGIISFHS